MSSYLQVIVSCLFGIPQNGPVSSANCLWKFRAEIPRGGTSHPSIYGQIDPALVNSQMHISITNTANNTKILHVDDANVALDNVYIGNADSKLKNIVVVANNGYILMVDSIVEEGYDVSFNSKSCSLLQNSRLSDVPQYIASLSLTCTDDEVDYLVKSMDMLFTSYVHHLSQAQLTLYMDLEYYPGKILTFHHQMSDKLGNNISATYIAPLSITIDTMAYSTILLLLEDNTCPLCDDGILINTISVENHVGGNLSLTASIPDDTLYLANCETILKVTGCPIMYGASDNKDTSIQCNIGYFNIDQENVAPCSSCDLDINHAVDCSNAKISIAGHHWMAVLNNQIVSGLCPSGYCCRKSECHYIYDKESLCALNREIMNQHYVEDVRMDILNL